MELQQLQGTPQQPAQPTAVPEQLAVPQVVSDQKPQAADAPNLFTPEIKTGEPVGIDKAIEKADNITSEVFAQAVTFTVSTDKETQEDLLNTAKQVVQDKVSTIADKASIESTAQHFLKYEDACGCFGYDEKTTTKFHVKLMAGWIFVLNTIYILTIGGFIVAPITFAMRKIRVAIKKTWLALLLALFIYLFVVVGVPAITTWLVPLAKGEKPASEPQETTFVLSDNLYDA